MLPHETVDVWMYLVNVLKQPVQAKGTQECVRPELDPPLSLGGLRLRW